MELFSPSNIPKPFVFQLYMVYNGNTLSSEKRDIKQKVVKSMKQGKQSVRSLKSRNRRTKSQRIKRFFIGAFSVLSVLVVLGGLTGWICFKQLIKEIPDLDISLIYGDELSVIYDKEGQIISEFGLEKRSWIEYDDISPVLIDAFVATEDSNFFKHSGVDFKRLAVAMVTNVLYGDDQGASTITQQLIKQTHLTSVKSFERKAQEMVLSWELERTLSKEQIIEAYLNYSYFGAGLYGVEKAAQYYFGVSASEVNLAQASTLAGLVQRPEAYRPDKFPDLAEDRRRIVLTLMVRHGYITDEEKEAVLQDPLSDLLWCETLAIDNRDKYQSFLDVVLTEVETKYGLDPRKGLEIYTTLDPAAQEMVYDLQHPDLSLDYDIEWSAEMQSGIVLMETQTGEIRAIGGGYHEDGIQRSYNLATQLQRQPGSTAKPIFAFGPAIEYLNWGTGTTVNDELYTYQDGSEKIIHNYTLEYLGRMTIRHALNKSLNVPAVKAFNAVGAERVQTFAENLGFTFDEALYEPAAIGGVEVGFSPLQMAAAYAAFGNGGTYYEPITVTKIVTQEGKEITANQTQTRAMSEETAYLMTDMLHTVMTDGTGRSANVEGMYLSGKTGTTNFPTAIATQFDLPSTAIRDSWFVGFSSQYTAAIWTGYDDASTGQYITSSTQSMPWKVFNRLMTAFNTAGNEAPNRPSGIVEVEIEKESGQQDGEVYLSSELTPSSYRQTELFTASHQPTEPSSRFTQIGQTDAFTGESVQEGFVFHWNPVGLASFIESELEAQIQVVTKLGTNATYLRDLPVIDSSESELRMLLRQIQAVGQTIYEVMGQTYTGESISLGTTSQTQFTLQGKSLQELSNFTSFILYAYYEKTPEMKHEISEPIQVSCETCLKPVELPNMVGWTGEQVQQWATEHGREVTLEEQTFPTEVAEVVIETRPNQGILNPMDTLVIVFAKTELAVPDYRAEVHQVDLYRAWAHQHQLTVEVQEIYHATIPKGEIVQVHPQIGSIIQPQSIFTLILSLGIEDVPPVSEEPELTPPPAEDELVEEA